MTATPPKTSFVLTILLFVLLFNPYRVEGQNIVEGTVSDSTTTMPVETSSHHLSPEEDTPDPLPRNALEPFVDPLPIPPVAEPTGTRDGLPHYEVTMKMVNQKVHRDLPPTPVFTYNGIWPGPTFEIEIDKPISVTWRNELPQHYPDWLPVVFRNHVPDDVVRTVVHLHGGITPSIYDGYPEWMWEPGEEEIYNYPNLDEHDDGSMLWYHDHAMGNTRLNVYAGLAGFYLLRNQEKEEDLNLPKGKYEVPLVLQDRNFAEDGTLIYPGVCRNFGVVNGKVFPYHEVEPRKYRFRILNGSNFRIKRLELSNGQPMQVIGVDDGYLNEPVSTTEIVLGPAERADVIVDFSQAQGENITLLNTTSCFGPQRDGQGRSGDVELPYMMQFRVGTKTTQPDNSSVPEVLSSDDGELNQILSEVSTVRNITFDQKENFLFLINNRHWEEPIEIEPRLGESEMWNLINLTDEAHPFHIHLISFGIVERVPFREGGVEDYIRDRDAGNLKELDTYLDESKAEPPAAYEKGAKDVAMAPFGYVTRIAMRWYGYSGKYVIHCHLLDHEDNDMMRPIRVLEPKEEIPTKVALMQNYPNPFNPKTNISFELPEPQEIKLEVFNMLGQKVATLARGQRPAGTTVVSFHGAGLSSGIYLYKLTTPTRTESKKMTLIK